MSDPSISPQQYQHCLFPDHTQCSICEGKRLREWQADPLAQVYLDLEIFSTISAMGGVNLLTHDSRDTGSLNFQNIIVWSDGKIVPLKPKCHIVEVSTLSAVNRVLPIEALFSSNL